MPQPHLPTTLKVLKGTLRPDRTNRAEPRPEVLDRLPFPEHLPESHRPHWDRIAFHVAHLRCVTKADLPALEEIVGVKVEVEKLARSRKSTVKARAVLVGMMARFGMTPSDRQRVASLPEVKEDRLSRFKTYPGKPGKPA